MKISHIVPALVSFVIAIPLPASGQPTPPEPAQPAAAPEPAQPEVAPEPGQPAPAPEPAQPEVAPAPTPPAVTPEPAPAPQPGLRVAYDKGVSLTAGDGQFSAALAVRSQLRAELVRTEAAGEIQARFLIPRLRATIEGFALGPANTYKLEFEVSGSGSPGLKDYFVEHAFMPALRLRVGQWKRPFNRQELVSDFASEFLERSITDSFFGAGRDLGIAVHNGYEKSPEGIEWALGVFNGTGEGGRQRINCPAPTDPDVPVDPATCTPTTPSNVPGDLGPMIVAHVGWNHGGIKGYAEGDYEGGPLRYAVGASYKANLQDLAEDEAGNLQIQQGAEADFMVKLQGYDLSGAVLMAKSGDADPLYGFYAQAGAFVLPKQVQVAARYGWHQQETAMSDARMEALGAINWYFAGHAYKWMTDAGVVQSLARAGGGEDVTDFQARTQLQLTF